MKHRARTRALAALDRTKIAHSILEDLCNTSFGLRQMHNVLAFVSASMRLQVNSVNLCASSRLIKALVQLGEQPLANDVAMMCPEVVMQEPNLLAGYPTCQTKNRPHRVEVLSEVEADCFERGLQMCSSAVSVDAAPGKGRGVFATEDVLDGMPVLIATPLLHCQSGHDFIDVLSRRGFTSASKVHARSQLGNTVATDAEVAWRLSKLSDGRKDIDIPVTLEELLLLLSPRWLPLLGQHPRYYPSAGQHFFSQEQIDQILAINCHGYHGVTQLYAPVGLFNHSRTPNAIMVPVVYAHDGKEIDAVAIVVATRLQRGDEITFCYSQDPMALRRTWGIQED